MKPRILFILKKRHGYGVTAKSHHISSGLLNSAKFVSDMLHHKGFHVKLVEVSDNNCIDREVHHYKPTHVIIEALWVVPTKLVALQQLHPQVKWIVRIHSDIPFLANEGIAMEWIHQYTEIPNVTVAFNDLRTLDSFRHITCHVKKLEYLPNVYPVSDATTLYRLNRKSVIDVGCFGAIRPMKNHLIQAIAAIELAKSRNLGLRFHISGTRTEHRGDNVQKNLRALFTELSSKYVLIEHPWLTHEDFIKVIRTMDIGMQVSFSESFNIVSADFVNNQIPMVVSSDVKWASSKFQADSTSAADMVNKMNLALSFKEYFPCIDLNKRGLKKFVHKATNIWINYFK